MTASLTATYKVFESRSLFYLKCMLKETFVVQQQILINLLCPVTQITTDTLEVLNSLNGHFDYYDLSRTEQL